MKKWPLISSVIQLSIGILAIAAYVVLAVGGEHLGKWTVTLILAIAYVILGSVGIANWVKEKRR